MSERLSAFSSLSSSASASRLLRFNLLFQQRIVRSLALLPVLILSPSF